MTADYSKVLTKKVGTSWIDLYHFYDDTFEQKLVDTAKRMYLTEIEIVSSLTSNPENLVKRIEAFGFKKSEEVYQLLPSRRVEGMYLKVVEVFSNHEINTSKPNNEILKELYTIQEDLFDMKYLTGSQLLERIGFRFVNQYNPDSTFRFEDIRIRGEVITEEKILKLLNLFEANILDYLEEDECDRTRLNAPYIDLGHMITNGCVQYYRVHDKEDKTKVIGKMKLSYETLRTALEGYFSSNPSILPTAFILLAPNNIGLFEDFVEYIECENIRQY